MAPAAPLASKKRWDDFVEAGLDEFTDLRTRWDERWRKGQLIDEGDVEPVNPAIGFYMKEMRYRTGSTRYPYPAKPKWSIPLYQDVQRAIREYAKAFSEGLHKDMMFDMVKILAERDRPIEARRWGVADTQDESRSVMGVLVDARLMIRVLARQPP